MKIEQNKEFTPVVIKLESEEEVNAIWDALSAKPLTDLQQMKVYEICDWFAEKLSF